MTVWGYFFLCFAGFWNADCRQIGRLCLKSLKSLRKSMEITDKNPIDKIGKKGYNIRKSGKADGIMQTGCRTNGYATPCETAFSARACRYAVYGISDTAVAVSVFAVPVRGSRSGCSRSDCTCDCRRRDSCTCTCFDCTNLQGTKPIYRTEQALRHAVTVCGGQRAAFRTGSCPLFWFFAVGIRRRGHRYFQRKEREQT